MSLIIIDLQEDFLNDVERKRCERLINRSVDEIQKARWAGRPIIVLNFEGYGELDDTLKGALQGYHDVTYAFKNEDDGWGSLSKLFNSPKGKRFGKNHYVIGINCHYCVGETVHSMIRYGHNPTLIWGAIDDAWHQRNEQREYIKSSNIPCCWK